MSMLRHILLKSIISVFFMYVLSGLPGKVEAEEFYGGKTIRIIVGLSPGGGFDTYSRLLARHISKYIPGNPSIIVQNMPGAGSIVATNYLYNKTKRDGTTIGILMGHVGVSELLGIEQIKAKFAKFTWLGVIANETTVLTVRPDLPHKDWRDLVNSDRDLFFGSTGSTGNDAIYPRALKRFNGAKVKVVTGFDGHSEVMLAIERKEMDGIARSYGSIRPFLEKGSVRPLLQSKPKRPELPNVPLFTDVAPDPTAKAVFRLADAGGAVFRSFAAPPGIPDDRAKILRVAFRKALADPQLLAEAEALKREVSFVGPEEVQQHWEEISETPPKVVEIYKELTKK